MTEETAADRTCGDFTDLTPDVILDAVETALGRPLVGFTHPLASYINRVYELQQADGTRIVAKFYRPGRWSRQTIADEHRFVLDCTQDEIPVVAPFSLANGTTIAEVTGTCFCVYPKRFGRPWEATCDEDWRRIGSLLARMHVTGSRGEAPNRVRLSPSTSTERDVAHLVEGGFIPGRYRKQFADIAQALLDLIRPRFDGVECIRIHGDCHAGNILERPGEGLMLIDFDDMVAGPPVQDLWMLLPDRADRARRELDLVLEAYSMFRDFDARTFLLIEPLRAMRMLYFLAWVSRQVSDPSFERRYPNWGTDRFWAEETQHLREQFSVIREVW